MPITLPKTPDGAQYEDLVVAGLRALGYFVESQMILRESSKEVLEIDAVATPGGGHPESRILFEAKKERFSFPNVFKLFGQRTYLGLRQATLVSMNGCEAQYLPAYQSIGEKLGVVCRHFPASPGEVTMLAQSSNELDDDERKKVAAVSWYQQIARRIALAALVAQCKSHSDAAPYSDVRRYLFNVRASFFQGTPLERAESLYSAYLSTPKLAGKCLAAIEGSSEPSDAAWGRVNDTHEHVWVQAIMQLEWAARLVIVKNAYDDLVLRGGDPPPSASLKIGTLSLDVPLHALPASFNAGLQKLREHPHAAHLPLLFQTFAELFGGVLFLDDPQELDLLSRLSGVPASEIISGLGLLDRFFGSKTSFFYKIKDRVLCLKMTPGFVKGGGCFMRQAMFDLKAYESRYSGMGWLLVKWHNALYYVLENALSSNSDAKT